MNNQQPNQKWGAGFKARFKYFWHRFQLTRWLIVIALSGFLLLSGYLTFMAKTANVGDLKAALENPTQIYDRSNRKAGTLYSQKGTYVPLKRISPNVQSAVISTEDRNFYHEYGFSFKGYARAFFLYAKNKVLRHNYISGGGSTLTQQLAKNAYLTQEQTFTRKFKELFLSIEIENVYSKKDILSMYLNNAYFGNGVWGVQDAAERYFGTSAEKLTVPESAVLAGMLTSPSGYNPIDHPAASRSRRNVVIGLMAETGAITSEQAKQYQATALTTSDNYAYKNTYKYPYFFDAVINEAVSKYGLTESEIMNKGYKIYTTLDQSNQQQMQTLFKNDNYFPANASDGTKVQAASIAIDPDTGGVEAVVGGRGKHVFRGYNRATQMQRQPGSTIKPLAVYTPALENGYYYDSEITDKKKSYGSNHYTPENYGNQYSGKIPMYQALAQSTNAPAVWLLNKIGVDKGYESVKKFGLPVTKSDKNLALALGGLKTGVSPQQLGQAYTAFANNGTMSSAHYIRKIVDASGNVVVSTDDSQAKTTKVMSQKTAKQMTSMMMGVFNYGTGASAKPYGYTIAGKTGSTEADGDADATRDKWIVGYTPDVVVTTWEGFDSTSSKHHLENVSGTGEGPLFQAEMQGILPNTKGTSFTTKDASTLAKAENNGTGSGSSDIWDQVQNGIDNAGKTFNNAANTVKSWWEKAKSYVE
ncbi:PBP1A family penicillin-binding protein [Levilactobacillus tujiorum]|uniref:PBP1A family penicillin-binding protein n=1 Tax=Levilactobacillus tujiorum TaxID=2912243 RepID=A0ABX1L1K8_9LACO|nr:PBP1A family penicillin-binding protein [Levilactobacillus tujiorum]MCH5463929.1 PBP1A family penicillin-binding protein [Levilactobacillus tujiorum]NLR11565.1 PBP1A family penicillin-binding protein [Lactobacillus sp. HBUAS51387]NLR28917.1 PBP1A family penicillin-binding protein [Levilactobacillus tujiorum]